MVQFWKSIQNRLSKAVVGLQSPSVESVDFYNNEMPLGRGTYIGNDLIFSVQTGAATPNGTLRVGVSPAVNPGRRDVGWVERSATHYSDESLEKLLVSRSNPVRRRDDPA